MSVGHVASEKDAGVAREKDHGGALEELRKVLIQKNQQLDSEL